MPHYLIIAAVLLALYAVGIYALRYIRDKRWPNVAFPIVIFIFYLYVVITMYLDVGFHDWNFQNTLPTANVSPFTYCLALLTLVLPKKVKEYIYTLIALLSFGLLVAGMLTCFSNAARDYAFHWTITFDSLAHVLLSLFGVYLVKSGQVRLEQKKCLFSGLIIVGVAVVMLVLNLIFHTAFFGLSLHGKHNIYNMVLCESGYLSAGLYFIGLCAVLTLGYFYQKGLQALKKA
ncbi:MAG: hypothetical protein IKA57_01095 [Clostridia bacterium]|nr:hypothetical protein [Clostridia bacterium]